VEKISHVWHKTKLDDGSRISAFIKNPKEEVGLRRLKEEILSEVKKYAPKYPKITRKICKD
jgi:dissimilatory sulfite reductase (desulfoviridin) alpha/beta subunit